MSKERIIQAALAALPQSEVVTATNIGRIVDSVFESIAGDVANGYAVQIGGFGTFKAKDRAARKGRNPQTGAEIDVPASRTVSFKPATKFKARL